MVVKILLREKGTNRPIAFVPIRLEQPQRVYRDDTDDKGWAIFDQVVIPDGKYVIKIRSASYRPYTEKHYISQNSIIMNIMLERSF